MIIRDMLSQETIDAMFGMAKKNSKKPFYKRRKPKAKAPKEGQDK